MDLGFGMARLWWGMLFKAWLVTALPVFIVMSAIFYKYPIVASLIFWWLKPAYEQLPLIYLSRALFKEEMTLRELMRELPRCIKRQLIANITWRRLSLVRSFTAPIAQLEGLSGNTRRERVRVLVKAYSGAGWLTVVGVHIESILYFSIIALVWFVLPEQVETTGWFDEQRLWVEFGSNVAYFIGAAVIAPFYVSSGFSLYLNRRAQLEGWDIELEFRLLQQRLQKRRTVSSTAAASVAAIMALTLLLPASPGVQAQELGEQESSEAVQSDVVLHQPVVAPENAKQVIDEVLAHEDFGKTETKKVWKYKGKLDRPDTEPVNFGTNFIKLFAQVGEVLLWIAVAVLIAVVIYNLPRWKSIVKKPSLSVKRSEPAPKVLFGLDVTEESLPDNVAEEALRLLQAQQVRAALSLLYRGSLAVLVNRYGVELKDSNTEGECAHVVEDTQEPPLAQFFRDLTGVWVQVAYGHLMPPNDKVQSLCTKWNTHFGEVAR
jgi:hypothetical protein